MPGPEIKGAPCSWLAWPWFLNSFRTGEISHNAGGLILWPAKILVLLGFSLLTLQACSEIIKRIAVIRGDIDDPNAEEHVPPAVREMQTGYDKPGEDVAK